MEATDTSELAKGFKRGRHIHEPRLAAFRFDSTVTLGYDKSYSRSSYLEADAPRHFDHELTSAIVNLDQISQLRA